MSESDNNKKESLTAVNCDLSIAIESIEKKIHTIREVQVILDKDLAVLYGVETKVLNQAVKRNIERFPERFRFQLSDSETNELVTNCDRFESLKHSSVSPYVFTEQGVAMLSSVLKSETAISVSIQIMDAFVAMRHILVTKSQQYHQVVMQQYQKETDKRTDDIFHQFEKKESVNLGIFYDGQAFDSYVFVSEQIKKARKNEVYHIGASIKDLGKKRFAFTLMLNITATEIINHLNGGL